MSALQSILVLHAAPGRFDDLVAEYERVGVIEAAIPFGVVRGEALVSDDEPDRPLVTSLWADAAAYDGWLASDERKRVTAGLQAILDGSREQQIHKLPVQLTPADDLPVDTVARGAVRRLAVVLPEGSDWSGAREVR